MASRAATRDQPGPAAPARRRTFPRLAQWIAAAAVAVLLAVHFGLAVGGKRNHATTSDELVHLTAGFSYWKNHDYRLHPENGVLPQRWAALPTYLAGASFPKLDQVYWETSDAWVLGHQFFYETGEDHFPRLMAARAMIALFSVATGLLVFLWSRHLFGTSAAFLSLVLFAFSPTFLAHGALATSDVCMTFFFLASVGAYWRHLEDGRWTSAALSTVSFGLACVAKFSAVLLLPMFGILALVRLLTPAPIRLAGRVHASRRSRLIAISLSALAHGAVAVAVIWAFFGFRYSAFNPSLPAATQFIRSWELINQNIGLHGELVRLLAGLHALPEAFLYGYAYVIESAQTRGAFLNGEHSITGWVSFFPWAFLLKTTIPVLLACATGLALLARRWTANRGVIGADLLRVLPLVALFTVYWAFSLTSHLNIGHRHILPTYPVLFILLGGLAAGLAARRHAWRWALVVLAGWQAGEAARIAPHFLAYFNPIAGGPANGHRHLVDSSLDWGQDLPGLARWLETHARNEPVYLSYFGTGEPAYYGIRAQPLEMINGFKIEQPFIRLQPGLYAVSATSLQHVYGSVRGAWTLEHEKAYQDLRRLEPALADYFDQPDRRAKWEEVVPRERWEPMRKRYEALRFARLCHYLRSRKPEVQIGYSIHVYRLSAEELDAATGPDLDAWRRAIERAIAAR